MPTVFEQFSDWIERSISTEGIVLTEETQKLVDWLAKVQHRSAGAVVNDLLAAVLEQQRRNEAGLPRWNLLTPRERDVAVLVIQDYTNGQIARTLGIETETVRTHIFHIQQKYGLQGKSRLRERLQADRRVTKPEQARVSRTRPPEPD